MTLLVGRQEGHPACKNEWSGAGMVIICLERGADLHMAQMMLLPLTLSCFSKIQVGFAFLVPANLDASAKNVVILQVMMMDFVVRFEDSHIPVTKTQSVYS